MQKIKIPWIEISLNFWEGIADLPMPFQADVGAAAVRAQPEEGARDGAADQDEAGREEVRLQGRGRVPHVSSFFYQRGAKSPKRLAKWKSRQACFFFMPYCIRSDGLLFSFSILSPIHHLASTRILLFTLIMIMVFACF